MTKDLADRRSRKRRGDYLPYWIIENYLHMNSVIWWQWLLRCMNFIFHKASWKPDYGNPSTWETKKLHELVYEQLPINNRTD
jgi:hypothetical protein